MEIEKYRTLNKCFKDKYIYRFGGCAGFFSEYNHMVLTMAFCLINRKRFVLMSPNANFASKRGSGWNQFFIPFTNEYKNPLLRRYNYRDKIFEKNKYLRKINQLYLSLHPDYHLMYEFVYDKIRNIDFNEKLTLEEIGFAGNLKDLLFEIDSMIWKYNRQTQSAISSTISSVDLPSRYIGLQIRRGDKVSEHCLYTPEQYMDRAIICEPNIHDVFVSTDDVEVVRQLIVSFPSYSFYHLCRENDRGYNQAEFMMQMPNDRVSSMIRLWASIDILTNAEFVVGTYSSNLGVILGIRMDSSKIQCLDFNEWLFW